MIIDKNIFSTSVLNVSKQAELSTLLEDAVDLHAAMKRDGGESLAITDGRVIGIYVTEDHVEEVGPLLLDIESKTEYWDVEASHYDEEALSIKLVLKDDVIVTSEGVIGTKDEHILKEVIDSLRVSLALSAVKGNVIDEETLSMIALNINDVLPLHLVPSLDSVTLGSEEDGMILSVVDENHEDLPGFNWTGPTPINGGKVLWFGCTETALA